MILFVNFDDLDTFNCEYGRSVQDASRLKIFVEGGLAIPYSRCVTKAGEELTLKKCNPDESEKIEELFPRHYLYDPSRDSKYDKWEVIDGLLRARLIRNGIAEEEWIQYTSKGDSQYAQHEFVGGCWFVFEGVIHFKKILSEYTADRKAFSGKEFLDEAGHINDDPSIKEYILEGSHFSPPPPGAITWWIHAQSFHIEISTNPEGSSAH